MPKHSTKTSLQNIRLNSANISHRTVRMLENPFKLLWECSKPFKHSRRVFKMLQTPARNLENFVKHSKKTTHQGQFLGWTRYSRACMLLVPAAVSSIYLVEMLSQREARRIWRAGTCARLYIARGGLAMTSQGGATIAPLSTNHRAAFWKVDF